jgi:hypothetical protein
MFSFLGICKLYLSIVNYIAIWSTPLTLKKKWKFNYLSQDNPIGDVGWSFRDKKKHWEHKNCKTFKSIREKKTTITNNNEAEG